MTDSPENADAPCPLIMGGCGRSAEEITPDTRICIWWALVLLTIAFALPFCVGCASAESRLRNTNIGQ